MQSLGCTYESSSIDTKLGTKKLYSVDVPASSDIYMIYNILEEGERNGVWMFQEGHVGHELNKAPLGIRGISRSIDG
jgi:hypothetical protein